MSIQGEINRINGNIGDSYSALEALGAVMPATENSDNLASTINTLPAKQDKITASGVLVGDGDGGITSLGYTPVNPTSLATVATSGSYNDLSNKPTIPIIPSNNVTGSGSAGYIAKWNGTNTITNGPEFGSSTTTYLRNDGSWATPPDTNTTYTLGTSGDNITLTPSSGTAQSITAPYATKATQDGSGNVINSTYMPKTGGTFYDSSGDDHPIAIRPALTNTSWIEFLNMTGSINGYLGVNGNKKPVFWDTSEHQISLYNDCVKLWGTGALTSGTVTVTTSHSLYKAYIIVGYPYSSTSGRQWMIMPANRIGTGIAEASSCILADEDANYSVYVYHTGETVKATFRGRTYQGALTDVYGVLK